MNMRHRSFVAIAALLGMFFVVPGGGAQAQDAEEDFLIVKYGSILVKSDQADAKVQLNGITIGRINTLIDDVLTGEHTISAFLEGGKTVSGKFLVKKNEVLKLEARFKEGKLVSAADPGTKKKKRRRPGRRKKGRGGQETGKEPGRQAAGYSPERLQARLQESGGPGGHRISPLQHEGDQRVRRERGTDREIL
jgi:hypothetical protein